MIWEKTSSPIVEPLDTKPKRWILVLHNIAELVQTGYFSHAEVCINHRGKKAPSPVIILYWKNVSVASAKQGVCRKIVKECKNRALVQDFNGKAEICFSWKEIIFELTHFCDENQKIERNREICHRVFFSRERESADSAKSVEWSVRANDCSRRRRRRLVISYQWVNRRPSRSPRWQRLKWSDVSDSCSATKR